MTVAIKIVLEADDDMIDEIIEELHNECDYWARNLLEKAGLDDLEWDEYVGCKDKLAKEIFDDVVDKLIFDRKGAE
jgi:hypothetical protein